MDRLELDKNHREYRQQLAERFEGLGAISTNPMPDDTNYYQQIKAEAELVEEFSKCRYYHIIDGEEVLELYWEIIPEALDKVRSVMVQMNGKTCHIVNLQLGERGEWEAFGYYWQGLQTIDLNQEQRIMAARLVLSEVGIPF